VASEALATASAIGHREAMTVTTAQWNLPDSVVAKAAFALVADASPAFLTNHCVRSYLYAREIAAAQNLSSAADYDDETLYLACLLHDLGLTDYGAGDQRFEIEGADAAVRFLRDHDLPDDRITVIWQAIALHSSLGLNNRFGTVQAMAGAGISFDIDGMARDMFTPEFLDRVVAAWPRHDVGYALADAIADDIRAHPGSPLKAPPFTLPAHMNEMVNAAPHLRFTDFVAASGWGDRLPR
jgi:hypothetical protein